MITHNTTPISEGKTLFKINGKTPRDDECNVIYADVVNGRVELPDVNITSEWTKDGTKIQAVYCGNEDTAPIFAEETVINITKPEATVTITAPETATAGETITLTATVTDKDKQVNSGRVVFKLNGKTLKDADGNALYVNVKNGTATTTITIPAKTKAKAYTLTAVFTDMTYERAEDVAELVVTKV